MRAQGLHAALAGSRSRVPAPGKGFYSRNHALDEHLLEPFMGGGLPLCPVIRSLFQGIVLVLKVASDNGVVSCASQKERVVE